MNAFAHAKLIWLKKRDRAQNRFVAFQKSFRLTQPPTAEMTLRISAYSHYQVAINGRWLGRGPDPSNHRRYYVDEYEAAPCLRRGVNTINVLAYAFGPELPWPECAYLPGEHGWLIFELADRSTDRGQTAAVSDASCRVRIADAWRRRTTGYTELRAGYKEIYDASRFGYEALSPDRAEERPWRSAAELTPGDLTYEYTFHPKEIAAFRTSTRQPAAAHTIDGGFAYGFTKMRGWQIENPEALVAEYPVDAYYDALRNGEPNFPMRRMEAAADNACRVHAQPGCGTPSLWLDFGGMQYGTLCLDLETESGGSVIEIGYGESPHITYVDRYRTRPGRQRFAPFHYRAGRYVLLTFSKIAAPIRMHGVTFERCEYPVAPNANPFHASSRSLNKIAQVSANTLHLNMHSHFEDCPWREQKLYIGDLYPEALACYYLWGEYGYVGKNLQQLAARQRPDGWITAGPGCSRGNGLLVDFPIYFVYAVRDYALFSGDRSLPEQLYPAALRIVKQYLDMGITQGGLIDIGDADSFANWCFINWNDVVKKGHCAALNFLFAGGLSAAADLADWLNRPKDARHFRRTWRTLRQRIDHAFWVPSRRLYRDAHFHGKAVDHASTETNVLALRSGLPRARQRHAILKALTSGRLALETPTAFFNAFVAEALLRNYETAAGLNLIRHYWGLLLQGGGDAFAELFLPGTPAGSHPPKFVSLCHGFSSGPAFLLPAYILGIRPIEPGFRRFTVDPQPGALAHASGSIPTPHGFIHVRYDASATLHIEHPRQTEPVPNRPMHLPPGVKLVLHPR